MVESGEEEPSQCSDHHPPQLVASCLFLLPPSLVLGSPGPVHPEPFVTHLAGVTAQPRTMLHLRPVCCHPAFFILSGLGLRVKGKAGCFQWKPAPSMFCWRPLLLSCPLGPLAAHRGRGGHSPATHQIPSWCGTSQTCSPLHTRASGRTN